jgi:hypothetical protein
MVRSDGSISKGQRYLACVGAQVAIKRSSKRDMTKIKKVDRMTTKEANMRKTKKVARRAMTKKKPPECGVEITKTDMFVVHDGIRIAKRGKPGTPQAKTWISLEPGYVVFNTPDLSEIVVQYTEPNIQ